jgi:membrane-associated phospholipid phosphatase
VGLLTVADDESRRFFQRNRTATTDDISKSVRWVGAGANAVGIVAGVTLLGALSREQGAVKAGLRSGAAVLLAEAVTWTLKPSVGRSRPYQDSSQYDFDSFGGRLSFPSGHSTVAFALATVYSDAIDHPVATVGLYTLATAVAWSRLNDDEHWLSDVAAGAIIGTAAGKIVDGKWRIFGLRPPAVLLADGRVGLAFELDGRRR